MTTTTTALLLAMRLPENFVKTNLEKAQGVMMFGVPLEDLSKDELIACVVAGWSEQRQLVDEGMRRLDFMAS
jgi:hypothetical protein